MNSRQTLYTPSLCFNMFQPLINLPPFDSQSGPNLQWPMAGHWSGSQPTHFCGAPSSWTEFRRGVCWVWLCRFDQISQPMGSFGRPWWRCRARSRASRRPYGRAKEVLLSSPSQWTRFTLLSLVALPLFWWWPKKWMVTGQVSQQALKKSEVHLRKAPGFDKRPCAIHHLEFEATYFVLTVSQK